MNSCHNHQLNISELASQMLSHSLRPDLIDRLELMVWIDRHVSKKCNATPLRAYL